jgi:ubiquinone biosynthesis O-methyltransferase
MPPSTVECPEMPRQKNFDKHELAKHAKHADDWYNPQNHVTKLLHEMNGLRVPMVVDGLISTGRLDAAKKNAQFPLEGLKILDVGCGAGIFSEGLARLHANMVGLDAAEDLIIAAKKHKKLDSTTDRYITYVCETIEDFADKNPGAFDVIVSSEVVEHVSDQKSFLTACAKALKVGTTTN